MTRGDRVEVRSLYIGRPEWCGRGVVRGGSNYHVEVFLDEPLTETPDHIRAWAFDEHDARRVLVDIRSARKLSAVDLLGEVADG